MKRSPICASASGTSLSAPPSPHLTWHSTTAAAAALAAATTTAEISYLE